MTGPRLAYLCSDPGIPLRAHKGASVHFREFGQALMQAGARLHAFVAKLGDAPVGEDLLAELVAPPKDQGLLRELGLLRASHAMATAIATRGPFDAVYERLSLFGVAGLAYAQSAGVPLLVEVNAPLWDEAARFRDLALARTARAVCLDVLGRADAVLCVSQALAATLAREGVDERKLIVQPNGVNGALFGSAQPALRPAALAGKSVLTFIGSLKPWHGVEFLLEAFARLRERSPRQVALWVVGDGPLAEQVAAAAQRWPGAVVLHGAVPHHEIPAILLASDIALAPYPADAPDYFCPLKVVEALAGGCPLVASRVPCVTDVVGARDGVELFAPGDHGDFVAAVERSLARGKPARRVAPEWTWATSAKRVLDLLANLRRPTEVRA
jgi:glycosyltransferase involved in cell wall biosynthesis